MCSRLPGRVGSYNRQALKLVAPFTEQLVVFPTPNVLLKPIGRAFTTKPIVKAIETKRCIIQGDHRYPLMATPASSPKWCFQSNRPRKNDPESKGQYCRPNGNKQPQSHSFKGRLLQPAHSRLLVAQRRLGGSSNIPRADNPQWLPSDELLPAP